MKTFFVISLSSLFLFACGGSSVCDDIAKEESRIFAGKKSCGGSGLSVDASFDVQTCKSKIEACSSQDLSLLQKYADCLSELAVCSTDNASNVATGLFGCAATLAGAGLSDDCTWR